MRRILFLILAAAVVFAADDPWAKVRDLKSGTELRIVKRGAAKPILANMDELTDGNLVVVIKNEQVAIPRDQIERVDYRPVRPGGRVTKETKVTRDDTPKPSARESQSVTSGVTIGSKPDFETIYRRTAPPPRKEMQ